MSLTDTFEVAGAVVAAVASLALAAAVSRAALGALMAALTGSHRPPLT
jgi:hypothetical protein